MKDKLGLVDFLNDLKSELTEDDTLLVMYHNKKDFNAVINFDGNWEDLSVMLSVDKSMNHTDESFEVHQEIKKTILNIAVNICNEDESVRDTFLAGLMSMMNTNKIVN